jgi:hypothetical protein
LDGFLKKVLIYNWLKARIDFLEPGPYTGWVDRTVVLAGVWGFNLGPGWGFFNYS